MSECSVSYLGRQFCIRCKCDKCGKQTDYAFKQEHEEHLCAECDKAQYAFKDESDE